MNVSGMGDTVLAEETSLMWRGSALAAARFEPNEDVAAGLWLGFGAQYELYDPLHVTQSKVTSQENDTVSMLGTGRLRLQARLVPKILAARVQSDAKYFRITRDSLGVSVGAGGLAISQVSVESHQLEISSRAFLELDQKLFGVFVPGLTAGLDYVSLVPETGPAHSTLVPTFGVGLRSQSF